MKSNKLILIFFLFFKISNSSNLVKLAFNNKANSLAGLISAYFLRNEKKIIINNNSKYASVINNPLINPLLNNGLKFGGGIAFKYLFNKSYKKGLISKNSLIITAMILTFQSLYIAKQENSNSDSILDQLADRFSSSYWKDEQEIESLFEKIKDIKFIMNNKVKDLKDIDMFIKNLFENKNKKYINNNNNNNFHIYLKKFENNINKQTLNNEKKYTYDFFIDISKIDNIIKEYNNESSSDAKNKLKKEYFSNLINLYNLFIDFFKKDIQLESDMDVSKVDTIYIKDNTESIKLIKNLLNKQIKKLENLQKFDTNSLINISKNKNIIGNKQMLKLGAILLGSQIASKFL